MKGLGLANKLIFRTLLLAEELIPQLIRYASDGARLRVRVRRYLGDISVSIRAAGERFDPYSVPRDESDWIGEMEDEEAEQAIRGILLKSQGDKLKISHKNGVNRIRILACRFNQQMVFHTTAALFLGLLCGLLMKFVFPTAFSDGLETYLLDPIKTMFMNALKIVIGPVIFFSIVSCISKFKDLSELGRIGAKVMGTYMITTVIAVLLSFGIYMVFHPGTFGFALALGENMEAVSFDLNMDTSLLHTIINIVPSNFLSPFLESDTLQIIFLAVLCGAAIGLVGEHTATLQEFFEACNSLFLTITTILSRLIPLVVFCSVAVMIEDMGRASLVSIFGYAGVYLIALSCMMLIYGLMVLLLARAYGVTAPESAMVSLAITIILLSLGCPGIPGASIVCLCVILASIGVPIEAIGLIMGINPFLQMANTMSNTTGDIAASLIVARSEGLLDLETYNSRS